MSHVDYVFRKLSSKREDRNQPPDWGLIIVCSFVEADFVIIIISFVEAKGKATSNQKDV